jgi:hypothetical protein
MIRAEALRLARALAGPACALAVIVAAADARADETDACLAASDSAQKERDSGHLIEAEKQFLQCSRDVCPRVVRNDCGKWASDVQDRTPTLVFAARDNKGTDLVEVGVEVDGTAVASKLDGRAVPMNPGEHHLRFTHEGSAPLEQTVVVREREKGRTIAVEFAPPEAPAGEVPAPPPAEKPASPIAAYVLGGVGVLSLGSFAYFGISGSSDASNLRNTCAPHCADSSVSDVRSKLLIADVSLGVGVASLAVAGYLLFFSGHHDEPAHAARLSLDVVPTARGQAAVVTGSF